jgi:hypothetical protein
MALRMVLSLTRSTPAASRMVKKPNSRLFGAGGSSAYSDETAGGEMGSRWGAAEKDASLGV